MHLNCLNFSRFFCGLRLFLFLDSALIFGFLSKLCGTLKLTILLGSVYFIKHCLVFSHIKLLSQPISSWGAFFCNKSLTLRSKTFTFKFHVIFTKLNYWCNHMICHSIGTWASISCWMAFFFIQNYKKCQKTEKSESSYIL